MSIGVELLDQLTGARGFNLKSLRGEPFAGVSTDTRTVQSGELFVALRGEKFDGHDFLNEAFDHGAAAAIVDLRWLDQNERLYAQRALVGVPDTLKALQELAREHRRAFDIPIIGVAGSNGKTTTKELIASVLGQTHRVLKTEGTLNNHIGVPLTLLRLGSEHRVAVIELGTNHPGEVAALCEVAEPTHGLITNIMREHMEFFGTIENVARAECELFDWLVQSHGTAFVNCDESLITARTGKLRKQWRFGFATADVDVLGKDGGLGADGRGELTVFCLTKGGDFAVRVGLVGRHQIRNALAAAAVGLHFGVPHAAIQTALASQKPAKHRMEVFTARGVTILDDTYNANPDSVLAGLQTLADFPCAGRKFAVLGDMLELGGQSETFHKEIGEAVRNLGITGLFTFGERAKGVYEAAALKLGEHLTVRGELTKRLRASLQPGDVVLLKGSRGMKLDLVVEELR
jgi:UDP-N-acetylmuramoyl-tripeptide--D-alanyl-D-alanine ligase